MHHARRPVASARPRFPRPVAPFRRPMEALEGRVLFAAGDFDTTFGGGDGAALVNFAPASSDRGTTLVTLPDGKTLVGGSVGDGTNSNDDFGIARLNADGS